MSPCTRITRVRELLMHGKQKESYGLWVDAKKAYQEGRVCKEELIAAQSMLQNNSRLQERLEYVEKKIQSIRTCGNVMSKERLLQILNSADVDEILSLAHVGTWRAYAILGSQKKKPFSSVEDLEEMGMGRKAIRNLLRDNHVL